LVLVSGDDQIAPGGFPVAEDLVVRLEDDNGNGIGGRQITWVVPSGSGSVTPVTATTNVNGLATTRWTLPSAVGGYTVSAVFSGLDPVTFSATATADVPTAIELVSGNGQSAPVGSAVPNLLVVRVTDASDNPVANVGVTWTAVGSGTVSEINTATDASGLASVVRTLGLVPGPYTTTAAVDGLAGSPVTFTSTATVGPPVQLALLTPPGSPTTSGDAFNPVPVIQLQDAQGNSVPLGGIPVTATITSGQAASLDNEVRNTNAIGRVTFNNLRITGPPDDDYVLTFTASVLGVPLSAVSSGPLVVVAGGADRIEIQQQPSSTVQNGVVFPQQPVVQVVDETGNPLDGNWQITVAIASGGGTLGGTVTANSNGTATAAFTNLQITGALGDRTLRFTSGVLAGAESNAITVTTGPAASISIQAGDDEEAPVSTAVDPDPAVIVRDAGGNPVSGVEVDFEVTDGDGSVAPLSVTTGTNGIATVDSWTLGPVAGANQLTATASVGSVIFNATGIAINTAPSAQADGYSVDEDATLTVDAITGVLSNDTDDDDLTAVLVAGPSSAQAFDLNGDGSFTYTPTADFNGSDSFTYQATDGELTSSTVTVTITVTEVNDAPGFQIGSNPTSSYLGELLTGHTEIGWVTDFDPGPPDESDQTVTGYTITTDNDDAFIQTPQVDPSTGTLTYRVQLTLIDVVVNASIVGTDSEGASSEPQDFVITIHP
jgi:hypothetical protein